MNKWSLEDVLYFSGPGGPRKYSCLGLSNTRENKRIILAFGSLSRKHYSKQLTLENILYSSLACCTFTVTNAFFYEQKY